MRYTELYVWHPAPFVIAAAYVALSAIVLLAGRMGG